MPTSTLGMFQMFTARNTRATLVLLSLTQRKKWWTMQGWNTNWSIHSRPTDHYFLVVSALRVLRPNMLSIFTFRKSTQSHQLRQKVDQTMSVMTVAACATASLYSWSTRDKVITRKSFALFGTETVMDAGFQPHSVSIYTMKTLCQL